MSCLPWIRAASSALRARLLQSLLIAFALATSACTAVEVHRPQLPAAGTTCTLDPAAVTPSTPDCTKQATERTDRYTMHVVEFDDEGWAFDNQSAGAGQVIDPRASSQIDSAIAQIKAQLRPQTCVRLFVYVHGWRHDARFHDGNVDSFRVFLDEVGKRAKTEDDCEIPTTRAAARGGPTERKPAAAPLRIQTVGIYVGWRGLSLVDIVPLVYASFWDRKNTADRVSQGSVRELFGRLNALARPHRPRDGLTASATGELRTYVIGHSLGASVAFRALSQSLIDSFSEDVDDDSDQAPFAARFVDMVVLVNPAIEAARFDPLFRAAAKVQASCIRRGQGSCARPYQAPLLSIFTSEGDQATKVAFEIGASFGNMFEAVRNDEQRRAILQTIGWNDSYRTHDLAPTATCAPQDATPYDESGPPPRRYKAPGWRWCIDAGSGPLLLKHVGESLTSPPTLAYNGPLWNVRVSRDVIRDHNDTWNRTFRELLLFLFTDERLNTLVP